MSIKRPSGGILLLVFAVVGALFVAGCGGSSSGCPDDDDGNGGEPPAPELIRVHAFEYDPAAEEYHVLGDIVSNDDVLRDLAGSLCTRCHTDAVAEMKDSVHYKIAGRTPRVMFPGGGAHGMLDRACGLPATTGLTNYLSDIQLGECSKCHVGRYLPVMEGFFANMFADSGFADPEGQAEQLVNAGIDCLICHAHDYKAHPTEGILAVVAGTATPGAESPTALGSARDSRDNADFNHDGSPDLVLDTNGDGIFDAPLMMDANGDGTPETPWPTVAQDRSLEALMSIGEPTEHSCLRCHEHARTGYKRGTLFVEGHDVHATADSGPFEGAENQCTVCHTVDDHKYVRGHAVGGDLAAADYTPTPPGTPADPNDPTDLTCTTCHDVADLQAVNASIHSDRHIEMIACETCHITSGSGITYSLFGHGGQVSFGRNAEGKDTKLVVADMYIAGDKADLDKDFEAYETQPIMVWFNGGTSFLAQSLSVRGAENARITPFKPMANGMIFDARFFSGEMETNEADYDYNAYSMYRFFANGNNAEAFFALDMLDMTPTEVRNITDAAFQSQDPNVQAMALMLIFPNLVYFDKANFGYEHYMIRTNSPYDVDANGLIDAGADFNFDMFAAANAGLMQFAGFNGPMGFPPTYEWYPQFNLASDLVSMKLPDGSLIKMFLQMQAGAIQDEDERNAFLAAVDNYPAFSNITLGGHGVKPADQALSSCSECHGSSGVMGTPHPVTLKTPVNMGPMGTIEFPNYQWKYYHVQDLVDLGLATTCEQVVNGDVDIDIDGNDDYVRTSTTTFILNWFMPSDPSGYRQADHATALEGTGLTADDLTLNGGNWMPVLEPVIEMKSNLEILGYPASGIPFSSSN
jgi:hypothetical protein